jgi:hypothetical protein
VPVAKAVMTKVPWARAWVVANWLFRQGRNRLEQNLTSSERSELWDLLRKSGGRRANLSSRQQKRFIALARQGLTGRKAT